MYRIIGSPRTRTTRVSWMMEELGQPYDFDKASPQSAEIKRLNPTGKVPVLVDSHGGEEVVVIDTAAICIYLADRHPEKNMSAAPGSAERAAIDSWLHFSQLDLEAPLWLKARHKFILPEELRLDVSAFCAFDFERAISAMGIRLGDSEFAIGDRFTAADVLLGHTGNWARNARFEINSKRVNAYFDRVLARPALARAREMEAAISGGGNL